MQTPAQVVVLMAMIAMTASAATTSIFSHQETRQAPLLVQADESGQNEKAPEVRFAQSGMVLNENKDRLAPGCTSVSEDVQITVRAGRKYATGYSGTAFGFDSHEWTVPPCARVTVTLINEDDIRHQWMVHELPDSVYPGGMFLIEVSGQGERTGSFLAPSENKTYLVHCHLAQHMEKGMKGQLVVGSGSGDLSSIPGISGPARSERGSWFGF